MIEEDESLIITFKNGDTIICMLDEEKDGDYLISGCLSLKFIDRGDHQGLSFSPLIPFDIEQQIKISKLDILYTAIPSPILEDIFLHRVEEYVNITIDYEQQFLKDKKDREKLLH